MRAAPAAPPQGPAQLGVARAGAVPRVPDPVPDRPGDQRVLEGARRPDRATSASTRSRTPSPGRTSTRSSSRSSCRRSSAAVGVVVGTLLAYAAASIRRPKWLRIAGRRRSAASPPTSAASRWRSRSSRCSAVRACCTKILDGLGFDLYGNGFPLDSTTGFVVVYSYFNIPLMVLITLPAIDGLKVVVARGVRQPRRHDVHVLAAGRPAGARCRRCSAGSCCCSPTRSAPTPRPRR